MTNISTKSRNGNITLIKFLFILCIVALHYSVPWKYNETFMEGGYIYVDFFFVVQGFYIENILRNLKHDCEELDYVVSRLKKFFPIVATQAVVLFLIESMFFCDSIKDVALSGIGTLYQVSFLSVLLSKNLLNNGTMWFLSAYVIGGSLMIFVIKRYKEIYRVIAPFVSAIIYNHIIHTHGDLDAWWESGFSGCLQYALPRAIAGISSGFFAREMYDFVISKNMFHKGKINTLFSFIGGGIVFYKYCFCDIYSTYRV